MLYLVFMIITIAAFGGAISAFIIAIVLAFKRRWWKVLASACVMILCVFLAMGSIVGLIVKAGSDVHTAIKTRVAASEVRRTAKIDARKALTPSVDWSKIDDEFWTYDGFRDWYRVPLRWPYEVVSVDETTRGNLARNIANGKSENGNSQTDDIQATYYMTAYAWDAKAIVFHRVNEGKDSWGWLEFDTQNLQSFDTEKEMWTWAKSHGWTHPETLKTAKQNYDDYWNS